MPTAGRLIGAITFGILAWLLATTALPYFLEGLAPGFWLPVSVGIGILVGWTVVGKRTGLGYKVGFGNGITGAVVVAFWMLLIVSFNDMIIKSMRSNYDGPVEALVDVFALMLEYGIRFGQPDILIILFGGGVVAGLISEAFGRRFP
jgi:hypothetical protein